MGRKCSVENCPSDSTKTEHTGVTFHKVPLHSDVRPKWLSLCRIPDDKTTAKLLYVCSRHFLRADFCSFKGKKYMLRQGVLPSVFPWDKSKLEAIKAEVSGKREVDLSKKKEKTKVGRKKEVKIAEKASTSKPEVSNEETLQSNLKLVPENIKVEQHNEANNQAAVLEVPPEIKDKAPVKEEVKEEFDAFDQHQRSQETRNSSTPINFTINSRIEVLDNNNVWYPAKVNEVDYEENEVLIHFEKFSNKFDEWISMTSPRLRPLQPRSLEKYEVGERCMAMWSDSRKFRATVTKILENDHYEVLFDDSFVKIVKNHKMSKMNAAKPAQSSPLFEPIKSTKQERRDKKRKLNVAALFHKRARVTSVDDKKIKASSPVVPSGDGSSSPASQEEASVPSPPIIQWHSTWENGKPVGIESTVEGVDGLRKSVIVPDPRLPANWAKHLSQRITGNAMGKWDAIIVAPDGKRFKSKAEVKTYLDLHPGIEASINMFDFSIYRSYQKRKTAKPKQKLVAASQLIEQPVAEPPVEEPAIKEDALETEEPPVSLKIIFDNDAYKCPIEGCGKNFRRENLALMHVKHYHSEYTKYLDSTPNVADLAYARTVGESLDRSPGPPKSTSTKISVDKTPVTPKVPKGARSPQVESKAEDCLLSQSKDFEIIKLLTQKPPDVNKDVQPLPSGLPSNMYPDIKLKDLLGRTDDVQMRDDINIKNLCSSRPLHGIKTLLPVRPSQTQSHDSNEEKPGLKRKRVPSETVEALKGKTAHQAAPLTTPEHQQHPQPQLLQQLPPPPQPQIQHSQIQPEASSHHNNQQSPESGVTYPSVPSAFDLAPPPAGLDTSQAPAVAQFDGVIIEGGKIIKLERMKQEEIINCTCGFMEEDGLMIQCELCLCWQHAYCNNIQKESEVPEKYTCYICLHPLRERRSAKYLHDQDWLKQGVLPVASYHSKDNELEERFAKLKKCHDLSGGILELREYMHTLAVKLKIAQAKNHPKLYLWSKAWEKRKLPEKSETKEEGTDIKPKVENVDHQYIKNELGINKHAPQSDSMLMMILKSGKEDMPMLNMHNNMAPIIPRPEAAIDSDDCRLNLLDHIAHAESLVEERLDDFERQLDVLEEGGNLESNEDYPKTRQTLQLLIRDLDTLKRFSELPMA